jgi:hypothetical protein
MQVKSVSFVVKMRPQKTYSSNANLQVIYGQSSKKVLPYTRYVKLPIFSAIDIMGWIIGYKYLLGWERLP